MRINLSSLSALAVLAIGLSACGSGQSNMAAYAPGQVSAAYAPHQTDRAQFEEFADNPVKRIADEPVSTFSIDVDTASYAIVRRYLRDGVMPPPDAVRIEEMVNYFDYSYPLPDFRDRPFSADVAVFESPWDGDRQLIRIGLQGFDVPSDERPPANLVFLLDVSGSMSPSDRLPLVQRAMKLLVDRLGPEDRISIVTYAVGVGTALEPTPGSERSRIRSAISKLGAGGGTAGAAGLQHAYDLAEENFDPEAVNRVILATDGDFNIGISDPDLLEDFIERKRRSGIYLSVLGVGTDNLNDRLMQRLAQAGNGNASYLDSLQEARKVLAEEIGGTLFTIADDVKIQVEFNPALVAEYRLLGYETRILGEADFANDRVDAGEIGSGHAVTALYEVVAPDSPSRLMPDRRYQHPVGASASESAFAEELAFLRIRYKLPGETGSRLIEKPIPAALSTRFAEAPEDARFATAVAGFGQILRQNPYVADFSLQQVERIARDAKGDDENGYRSEFLQLVRLAGEFEEVRLDD